MGDDEGLRPRQRRAIEKRLFARALEIARHQQPPRFVPDEHDHRVVVPTGAIQAAGRGQDADRQPGHDGAAPLLGEHDGGSLLTGQTAQLGQTCAPVRTGADPQLTHLELTQ